MPSDRNGKNVITTECKSKLGNVISTINNPLFAVDGIRLLSLASDFAVVIEEIDIEPWMTIIQINWKNRCYRDKYKINEIEY